MHPSIPERQRLQSSPAQRMERRLAMQGSRDQQPPFMKKRAGRPSLDRKGKPSIIIAIRLSPIQHAAIITAAHKAGQTKSRWMRETLIQASKANTLPSSPSQ